MVAFKSCGILKVQIVASLVVSVVAGDDFGNKNSITPLKAKSNSTTSGGKPFCREVAFDNSVTGRLLL